MSFTATLSGQAIMPIPNEPTTRRFMFAWSAINFNDSEIHLRIPREIVTAPMAQTVLVGGFGIMVDAVAPGITSPRTVIGYVIGGARGALVGSWTTTAAIQSIVFDIPHPIPLSGNLLRTSGGSTGDVYMCKIGNLSGYGATDTITAGMYGTIESDSALNYATEEPAAPQPVTVDGYRWPLRRVR